MPRLQVREHAAPQDAARRRDVVSRVERVRFFFAERVRKRVVPLLVREPDRAMPVRQVLEHRERRLELRER